MMTLFKRLPKVPWRPAQDEDILESDVQAQYPNLAADFEVLRAELLPHFRRLNGDALRYQNEFRLDQVIIIFGGGLATILGVLHASLPHALATWSGIVEAVLAAWLSAVALRARTTGAQQRYFTWRLKAEKMRAEYFLFLGGVGVYGGDDLQRKSALIRRVAEIRSGETK
jgi:Protein of unknown function (DUF4231)